MATEIDQAKAEWKKVSWIDQQDYDSFDEYYKSDAWRESIKRHAAAEKGRQEFGKGIFGFLIVIGVIYLLIKLAGGIVGGVGGFFGDKADKKARCQTNYAVSEAKTEFAAKKAYKKCMNR
tara:strand:+ start:427 stop:786 length:360 start_codon:yes stop_codon:yes gene_type:complete